MTKKQKVKQYLDNSLSNTLQGTLDRTASNYQSKGYEKQAKVIRNFKKEVRLLVGSL